MEKPWWNERRIEWYERASSLCDFQPLLSEEIKALIPKDESILEFGCGLGYVSEILSRSGYDISAFDIDERVIKRARKRSGLDIFHTSDYKTSDAFGDTVLLVFFGRLWLEDNLNTILSHAKKRIVSIHSLHRGQNNNLKSRNTPTLSESISYFREKGFSVEGKELSIPFPQPLRSMEEAELFIKENYPKMEPSLYFPYIKETDDKNYPFILFNEKKMVILDIEK